MRKFLTSLCVMALASGSALAAGAPVSRVIPTDKTAAASSAPRVSDDADTPARGAVTRTVQRAATATDTVGTTSSSDVAAPSVRARTGTTTVGRVVRTNSDPAPAASARDTAVRTRPTAASRSAGATASAPMSARDKVDAAASTVGRNARVTAAGINSNPSVRRAGLSLRPSTAEVGGRAHIAGTNSQTGSNIDDELRGVQTRAAATPVTAESIAAAKDKLEQTANLNKSCQEQYNDCMDQFCAVIDANQKRCSCSANLSKYTKVEEAVKDANTKLNDVAQRIRYVGLSADEIRAIMSETEAEEALSGNTDTSETRNMLAQIEKMIKDPTTSGSYSADTYSSTLDLDLDFSADTADIFSLDFLNVGTSGSFSNLRGTELYNAAKKRCNTVLTQCKEVGATAQQITGNYDLAIDKDCIAYEQGLGKMNDTLKSNVRSATNMLQKARLAVLQNKNQYDAKGCIGALETCMLDDMVCGDDYVKCLDPTKRYIDENGEVVLGQNISDITKSMTDYNSAAIDTTFLTNASTITINASTCTSGDNDDGRCVAKYLLQKIGTKQKVTDEGLCRAVLDKCQSYTYDANGNYKPYNDVVVNYIQRAMVNIKAAQQRIISDYASNCMIDIATCYNQQVTQVNTWSSNASASAIYNVMRGACRNVALTCAYAVFANDATSCPAGQPIRGQDGKTINAPNDPTKCIESISKMFYQSLLCPDNSSYTTTEGVVGQNNYVNSQCQCNTGYDVWNGACVLKCAANQERNNYGTCVDVPTKQEEDTGTDGGTGS